MTALIALYIFLALAGGLAIGYLAAQLRAGKTLASRDVEVARLETQIAALTEGRKQLGEAFGAVANDVLKNNSETFLRLAKENLGAHQTEARAELEKRQQAINELLKPINEALKKTGEQIQEIEKERHKAYGSLSENIRHVAETQQTLQAETRNLVTALRRPEVRGQWGEMSLRRLAELAGMIERCDFYEQETRDGDAGRMRPDMIVRMPDKRELIVDAKAPLDAYLSAISAATDDERQQNLKRHATNVRGRMRELATKAYWEQFDGSPDFVVLFIPGEQFLSAALEHDPTLLEDAFANKVILATPTSLIALLRAVAFGWRQQALAENAENVRKLGEDMYKRLTTFVDHLGKLGKSISQSVSHFNKAVGSLERQVLPAARRFPEMGVNARKEIEEMNTIDEATRVLDAIADDSKSSEM
ncbi:MAG TPA: DNA recombination protein RmuC [Gammaproteobacteria bacterium]|nr:DNA recombination protein RmuC [Gammaproteobacteria bacterium]